MWVICNMLYKTSFFAFISDLNITSVYKTLHPKWSFSVNAPRKRINFLKYIISGKPNIFYHICFEMKSILSPKFGFKKSCISYMFYYVILVALIVLVVLR